MRGVRLHGPADLRLEELPSPAAPAPGQAVIRVKAVGICGSDLHTYQDGRIGTTILQSPLVLGHEFAAVVEAVGQGAVGGNGQPLVAGDAVAVDPAQPCHECELCRQGHPNLCLDLHFAGHWPDDGALRQRMLVPASTCFVLPDKTDFGVGALLETFGVALHAIDLAKIRVGHSVAILGAGPIGLCILQAARLAGATPIYVTDKFPWRLELAEKFGAIPVNCDQTDPAAAVMTATAGRGVDIAIEAAWADQSIQQAADMARNGGRLLLVGIPGDDRLTLRHSVARRRGLSIYLVRRMKHVYPRAIDLHRRGRIDMASLISHRFPLEKAAEAFALNARYAPKVVKIIIDI
ncbi:MAG: alcohol dehydrogenase catalytic domain-containing protein [Tepidisphaeraceae bacterium]